MKDHQLAKQLMATFLEELHVHVSSLSRELMTLENNEDAEQRRASWKTVFRAAHTLKGASAVVEVDPIHQACHRLEDIFEIYRSNNEPLSDLMTSKLLRVVDAMEEMGVRLRTEQSLDDAPLVSLLPEVESLAAHVTRDDAGDESPPTEEQVTADEHGDGNRGDASGRAAPADASQSSASSINEALFPVFLEELEERCARLTEDAIAMESVSDPKQRQALLTNLFRAAHSLKGAAAVVKIKPIEQVCHRLEDDLDAIRSGEQSFTTQTATDLLAAVDAIQDAASRLTSKQSLDDAPITQLARRLESPQPAKPPTGGTKRKTREKPARPKRSPKSGPHRTRKAVAEKDAAAKGPTGKDEATGRAVKASAKPPSAAADATGGPLPQGPAESPATGAARPFAGGSSHGDIAATIRVPAQKLDALLSHSGELLVARGRLAFRATDVATVRDMALELKALWRTSEQSLRQLTEDAAAVQSHARPRQLDNVIEQTSNRLSSLTSRLDMLASEIESDNRLLQQTCGLLDDEVYRVRMLPFSDACGGLQRAVRDIATTTGKKIKLLLSGGDVEVDRSVLEGLKDPLLHLVRNAADHGIESPARRKEAGKPPTATITVSAALRGGQVEVTVEDDGGGLDLERICEIARKRDIDIPEDPREQARLIFAPGFSTAKLITDISGRGVGLDVVQSQVESLHGSVEISFARDVGTRFTVTVPLTLTTIRSMLVIAGGQTFAIPTSAIQRLVRFGAQQIKSSAGRDSLLLGDAPTAVVSLAETLGMPASRSHSRSDEKQMAIVLSFGAQRVAVVVDEVLAEQEVLVKNLGARVRRLRHFSGCTLLPSGHIALVMNSANVLRTALGLRQSGSLSASFRSAAELSKSSSGCGHRLLLAEDSVTTRILIKNILESAGYDVATAIDGQQAWELAQEQEFDLLVTDVDMPRMDGFDLTDKLRRSEQHRELPVILVTARGSDQDKQRGVQVGANAYIVKDSFEQRNLLDTISQLV